MAIQGRALLVAETASAEGLEWEGLWQRTAGRPLWWEQRASRDVVGGEVRGRREARHAGPCKLRHSLWASL